MTNRRKSKTIQKKPEVSASQKRKEQALARLAQLPRVDPLTRYTIPEASLLLRQSEAQTYKQLSAGTITPLHQGGRTFVPGSEIVKLSTLPGEAAAML